MTLKRAHKPDACIIRTGGLAEVDMALLLWITPDLVIEVIAPVDICGDISDNMIDYTTAGVGLVWTVDPVLKQVTQDGKGPPKTFVTQDVLTLPNLLTDLHRKVSESPA